MRLKTAAATAPALQVQTRPPQARLRAVSGKGTASGSAPVKPMAMSPSLRSRTAPKAASTLSAVPRKTLQLDPSLAKPNLAKPGVAKPRLTKASIAKPNIAQLNAAQQNAKLARRDRVVLEHLPLVKAIAIRVHENLPVHVDVDDLVHSGVLGLFDAASKYNPEKQVAFSSYAKHRIKGAILDSLRQLDWASRDMRRRHKQVEAATRELAATLQRNPTEAEVAQKLGIDQERWRSMMLDLRNVGLVSASTRTNESDDLPAPDFPCKPESHPDSICAREQLRGVLGVAMKTLPERYQKVVSLYYSGEMTMKEIGGILGINESRVSQIHKAALEKMQVVLQNNGISSPQAF
jgi:RNA polymerase sigma factor FliA